MQRALGPGPVALATLLACLGLFVGVRGPVRGALGDVLVVVLLVATLAAARIGSARSRILAVGVLSIGVELFQGLGLVGPDAPWFLHLTVGSTLDPWDLLWYALGLAAAAGLERRWSAGSPPA